MHTSYNTNAIERKNKYKSISLELSHRLRNLHQVKKQSLKMLMERFPQLSRRSIQRHMVKGRNNNTGDLRKFNGRKRVVQEVPPKANDKRKVKKKYKKVPIHTSVYMRVLHQELGMSGKKISKKCRHHPKSTVYRHINKEIKDTNIDRRHGNRGRPQRLSARDKRRLLNELPKLRKSTEGEFTVDDLRSRCDVDETISYSTVTRVLHDDGYALRDKRRKGILTENDTKIRLQFARHAKKMFAEDIWTNEISFYLDGSGFTHKVNPCENARRKCRKTWRKPKEGEMLYCTGADSREGDNGKVAKFMVAIAYEKGVTMCEEYRNGLNGEMFAQFILQYFPACFRNSANPITKVFLQDGDPSQNSKVAMRALAEIKGKKNSIPPRSPDLNPIENIFHLAKRKVKKDAVSRLITHESYEEYVFRVKQILMNMGIDVINRTIESMNKRINMVIKAKGQRIKY